MSKAFTIYRSSAGSGKTRTLAREYLKLALKLRSHYFRHILAVTFTNKATQEMKDRILAYLNEFASGKAGDLAEELKNELKLDALTFQQYAQEAQAAILHEYSHFSISTIDAFFQKVIRSFTREAGLTGDYRLEIDQDTVLEEVIDNLIDELGGNRELTEWVVEFAKENLENERPWDVRNSLLDFSREIFREEFKQIEDDVLKKTSDRRYFQDLKSQWWEIKGRFLNALAALGREALEIIRSEPWDTNDIAWGKQAGLISFFESAAYARRIKDVREPTERIRMFAEAGKNWPNKKTVHASRISQIADKELNPRLQKIIHIYESGITDALSAEIALQNLYVFGLVADISRKLREFKSENNVMLLADAPKFLNGVINDSDTPFIYEKVGSFYRNYLIDEFQDTSGLQWRNFLPLLLNSLDQGYPSLVVGDVKQAIYRWRGGDLNLLHQAVESDIGKHRVDVKNLNANYRSAPLIVEFNNEVFSTASSIVSLETGDVLSSSAYIDVAQHAPREEQGFVEVTFLRDDPEGEKWKDQSLQRIPRTLERLQDLGVPLRDIAILVRKNEEGQEVVDHLLKYSRSEDAREGFSYDVVSGESLRIDTASTVNLLEAAMRYLLNPADDIARAQLAFEFARLNHRDRSPTEVFSVTNQSIFESTLPEEFTRQKGALKKLPLFDLTETLIAIFKLGQYTGELPYLQAFQNLVLDFFTRERNDLGAFLEWWEVNKRKKSVQISGQVDAAQIISIHKSKGLQFKYVLIPFCSWSTDHDSFMSPQLWVRAEKGVFENAGFLPVKYSSTLERTHFRDAYREEYIRTYLDNVNLLYVAFTRAEKGLIVCSPHPDNKGNRKQIGALLYNSIVRSEKLKNYFNEGESAYRMGEVSSYQRPESSERSSSLSLMEYHVSQWRQRLVIRQRAKNYFQPGDSSRDKINYGIHLHAVLSRIKTEADVPAELERINLEGLITETDKQLMNEQLNMLMENPRIKSWFTTDWEVRTEVPILLPEGKENRIDRLLLKGKKAVVIDFKTGDPGKADHKQVIEYLDILRRMNFPEVEGYLLYVRTGEVISVAPSRARIAKKKDDHQLDLGL